MGSPMTMMGRPMEERRSLFDDMLSKEDPPMPLPLFQALGLPGFGRGPQQQQLFNPFGFGERPQQVAPMVLQSLPVSRPEPIAIQLELDEGESIEEAIQDAMLINRVVRMMTGAIGLLSTTRDPPSPTPSPNPTRHG
jgi:hypothetical protein